MTTSLKRAGTVLLSVLLLCTLALSAGAASKLRVGVKFWKTGSDKESMANSGIDTSREASLTRQSNGTYTLTLPIQQVSKMGVTGYLTGLTIGDVTYNGTVTGDVTKDTGVSGGFAEMDTDTCVVYSFGGAKLNSVQSGYARPALAAGKSRFVLYNRSGNELRVESRTQNLYTKTLDSSIYLCAVADAGQVAVATDDTDSVAKLTVYSSAMEQVLSWNLTSAEGTPLRMAFSPDSRRIAVAAVTANGGQLTTNLYVLALAQGDPVQLGTATSVPQWLGWLSGDSVLALYEDRAVLYGANGGEKASYDFGGSTLVDVDTENGGVALLLSGGQTCTAVLLDNSLGVQYSGNVPAASHILRAADGFYLLTDSTVECFNKAGEFQWTQPMDAKPQAGVLNGRQLLVFSGNTVQQVTAPEPDSSSAS